MPLDNTTYVEEQDEVLDLLRRARDRVASPGGWCQGEYLTDGGAVCALGAADIDQEIASYPLGHGLKSRLVFELCHAFPRRQFSKRRELKMTVPEWYQAVSSYNDTNGRTQGEIIALYDRAIALREAHLRELEAAARKAGLA
jgi:hypothetical protein